MYAHTTIGIDLGITSKHRACAIGAGAPPKLAPLGPSPADLDAMLDAVGGPDHVDVVIEPTGLSWVPVSIYLARKGVCVHRVDTRKAHGFRKVLSRNVKSDRADAEALARMLLIAPEDVRPLARFDGRVFMLARLVKTRESLIDDRTQVILRIKALLAAYVPTLVPQLAARSLGPVERVLLREFLDPRTALDAGPEGLAAAVKDAGLDAHAPKAAALIGAWVRAAEQTRKLYDDQMLFDIAQRQLVVHLDHFDGFESLITSIEADIAALYRALDPTGPFETLPGIGKTVGAALCGVLGGPDAVIERFPSADHLVSFVGFDPRKSQSGGRDREGQHISKSGSRSARRYLYLAAETARRRDPQLAAFYDRLRARGKHHNCAVVAVAAKLLRRLYAICKRAGGDGYEFRDIDGQAMTRKDASRLVQKRHPSKASRARAARAQKDKERAERRPARNTRQPEDSSTGSRPPDSAAGYPTNGSGRVPQADVKPTLGAVDNACAQLRS